MQWRGEPNTMSEARRPTEMTGRLGSSDALQSAHRRPLPASPLGPPYTPSLCSTTRRQEVARPRENPRLRRTSASPEPRGQPRPGSGRPLPSGQRSPHTPWLQAATHQPLSRPYRRERSPPDSEAGSEDDGVRDGPHRAAPTPGGGGRNPKGRRGGGRGRGVKTASRR